MIHQLRIYEIFGATRAAFHDRFRDHASRIMRRHGFDIRAMWETRQDERTEFVYLLAWPDEAAMKQAWAAFMGDAEWQKIRGETNARQGPLVGAIQDRTLTPVPYATQAG
jgi:heme-degrading monooxygenase HmoA